MVPVFGLKKHLLCIAYILTSLAGLTQPYNLNWKKYYGIPFNSGYAGWHSGPANVLVGTMDSGYVAFATAKVTPGGDVCNRTGRCWVNKFNKYGGLEWQKCYGGTLNYYTYDEPGGIVEDKDGNYLLAGSTSENNGEAVGNHGSYDGWVVKISRSNGNVIWARCYGGSSVDNFYGIVNTKDGGAVLCGSSASHDGDLTGKNLPEGTNAWMMRIDGNGNILWQVCLGANYSTREFHCIKESPDGSIVAAGSVGNNAYGYAVKVNASGVIVWEKSYGGSGNQNISDCAIGADNEIYVSGNSSSLDGDFSGGGGGFFLFKLNPNGSLIWKKFGYGGQNITAMALTVNNLISMVGTTKSFRDILSGLHVSYPQYGWSESDIYISEMDTSGKTMNTKCIGGTHFESPNYFVEAKNGGYAIFGITGSNNGDFSDNKNVNGDFFLLKIGSYNTIRGKVYYDYNANNVQDAGEPLFKNVTVVSEKGGGYNGMHTTDGLYEYTVDTGKIDTRILFVKPYYDVIPAVITTVHNDYHHTDTINFSIVPRPGIKDLSVHFSSEAPPRPGFENTYTLICQNKGTEVIAAGSIRIKADPRVTVISHDSSSFSRNGDTLSWNFVNLEPQTSFRVKIKVKVSPPPSVRIGDTLLHFIQALPIAGDSSIRDNTDTVKQQVIGSYDPNNKLENSGGVVAITKIRNAEYFNYCINFQNIGNDTAFNIVVRDSLDEKLDWTTLDMVASSHLYKLKVNNSKYLEWTFANIKLADKQHNESLSHGYILYRIKAKSSVGFGDTIKNSASIYFDYNMPVKTNTERTFIQNFAALPISLVSFSATLAGISIKINWQTSYENNSNYFDVERSTDGINFKTIGKINATNLSAGSTYQLTDNEPNKGNNYFRLKSVDRNGLFAYSDIKLVRIENEVEFSTSVYPNPSKGNITIETHGDSYEEVQLQVFDFSGKQVIYKRFGRQNTEVFKTTADLSRFSKGIYQVHLLINKKKYIYKVVLY